MKVYPDQNVTTFDEYKFFVSEINFEDATSTNFFIGAKLVMTHSWAFSNYTNSQLLVQRTNILYINYIITYINIYCVVYSFRNALYEMTSDLTIHRTYDWEATPTNVGSCKSISIDDVSIIGFSLSGM